ncbi:MAG: DUF3048 domain-containing protein [Candidatus Saccharibacteria bacterium]|nr:DUF3048 domain-containing protein [Candidatus Saccharibacteria bacterium]
MNSKQHYYGNIKKRSTQQKNETLANLYSNKNNDVEDFLKDTDDIDESELKEKKSAKKRREKAEHKAETKHKIKTALGRLFLTAFLVALIGCGIWFFLQNKTSTTELDSIEASQTKADEIYYSHLTGKEVSNKDIPTQAATCIMIENSPAARPQSGLNEAGVIYEAIAEGGITRFLAIFQEAKPNYIGPVRSVRLTFVEMAKPYHCSIAHVGGSDNALKTIRGNSEFRDIDQFYNAKTYWRIRNRASPHNVYTRFSMLDELNFSKGYRTSEFNGFARVKPDVAPVAPAQKANKITIGIGSNLYSPVYNYDANTNKYLRGYVQGGAHYSVSESGAKTQNAPDVVVAMKVNSVSRSSEAQYADYTTTGTGDATIFQNGGVISARWSRADKNSELKFVDASGNDIQLNRGQTWITLYPSNNKVTWE